jgi:DNA repair photolyase
MASASLPIHGRGASGNPPNRFEPIVLEADPEFVDDDPAKPKTVYLRDTSRTIIAHNDSPDVGFEYSINPYRGCEHGCVYCYARPTHEYFGLGAGLDFETQIFVKMDGPRLLRKELSSPKWSRDSIALSGVTDCYQPVERRLKLTRQLLEVLADFRNPCSIVTKNHLVTRDIDILQELAKYHSAMALISITTLDATLTAKMEPRTSSPQRRLDAIRQLSAAKIPVGVMVAPVIPGLTDHEIPTILEAAADAGARCAGYTPMRLPGAVATIFQSWLDQHFPDRKQKILNRVRSLRGGKLNESNFGKRMRGEGVWARQFKTMFEVAKRKNGLDGPFPEVSAEHFRVPGQAQMELWTSAPA